MTPGGYYGLEFWVYDVCQGLVFAEMAAAAEALPEDAWSDWTTELVSDLKMYACVNDFYIPVDRWARGHENEFAELAAQARDRLVARGTLTPEDAAAWILDGLPIHWRGDSTITTEAAVEFAEALIQMVHGTHPPAPAGQAWYFGANTATGEIATVGAGPLQPVDLAPGQSVDDDVERERGLDVVVVPAEGALAGERKGYLRGVGQGGAEFVDEVGGHGGESPGVARGVVKKILAEPQQAAVEDVRGVMPLGDAEATAA